MPGTFKMFAGAGMAILGLLITQIHLRAAYLVAASDGYIGESEMETLRKIANALGMTATEAEQAYAA